MSQTLDVNGLTLCEVVSGYEVHENKSNLEQLRNYFRRKIHESMNPLIHNILYGNRKNIFQIVGYIITELQSEIQDKKVQIELVPTCILPEGEDDREQSLMEIFSRSKQNYLQHPDILLKDLGIYEAYYQIPIPEENLGVKNSTGEQNNPNFTAALKSVLKMHRLDCRYISFFGIRENGVVYYIGNSSELGVMASVITDEVQRYYDDLQTTAIAG